MAPAKDQPPVEPAPPEPRRSREAVGREERMSSVGALAAGVAHELNNPLASIVANLGYLAERLDAVLPPGPDGDEIREALAEAREAGERMRSVIRGLQSSALGAIGEVRSAVAPAARAGAGRLRILLVDDEPLVVSALRRGLAREHEVTVAVGGREALLRVERGERWDAIVTDLVMPEVTGMDLHAAVEARDPSLASRMLFMTGGAFTPAARAFVDGMPERCLEKPFQLESLGDRIASLAAGSSL